MAYTKTLWENNATALSAGNMNHIEEGIYDAHQDIATNSEDITTINQAITTEALKQQLIDVIYPVGSIYMSATLDTAAKVGAALGGTWEAWGAGRVPVGVDTGDTDFNTPGKSGGSKYIQSHTHGFTLPTHTHGIAHTHGTGNSTYNRFLMMSAYGNGVTHLNTIKAGSGTSQTYVKSDQTFARGTATGGASSAYSDTPSSVSGGGVSGVNNKSTGESGNLQPYITCYMYKRTA